MTLSELLKKRIPTILGLLFLGAGLVVGLFVLGQGTGGFLPKASPETTPKQLKITNITDTTFTVSFLTDSAVPGYLKYGTETNKLNTQVSDDRDQLSGTVGQFTTHHITLRNLSPSTKYFFNIGTASKVIYTNNGQPYTVTTAPKISGAQEALTVYGSVLTKASTPAQDSIVYLSVDGASPLSSLVKSSGSWAIPLSTARTTDLRGYAPITTQSTLKLFIQGKNSVDTSTVTITVSNAQPAPAITLGQSKDFVQSESDFSSSQLGTATESTAAGGTSGIGGAGGTGGSTSGVQFTNPSQNGEELNTTKPELQGKAPPSTTLTIKVESDPVYTGTVITDSSGNWSYTPPANLTPGEHTITVTYKDVNGVTQTEKRTFLVLASGSSSLPAITSTPSATPRPTPLPRAATPATSSGVPKAGSTEETMFLFLAGLLFVFAGAWYWQKSLAVSRIAAHTPRTISLDGHSQEPYAERENT